LLAIVTGRLFELGGDLGDTTFAVLGEEAQLGCVCRVANLDGPSLAAALREVPSLANADVSVRRFDLGAVHTESGRVTHRMVLRGLDRPGLVARLAEGFGEFGANIVRMDAEHVPRSPEPEYVMRFEVAIPPDRVEGCVANAENIAESMGLSYHTEVVD
jgi:glycine cleavage system transcriptional repressor